MAKAKTSVKDIYASLNKINPLSSMDLGNSDIGKIQYYIDMGNWILNAAVSGSIKKGIANNKIYQVAGESGAGKTFLCLNIIKNAQDMGSTIIYIDTEAAIDYDMLENFGIDTSPKEDAAFIYMPVGEIGKLKSTLTTLVKDLKQVKIDGGEIPKMLIILDSIGMIASDKEVEDAITENHKADFTRAKGIRSLFRNVTLDLGLIGVPMIYTNHVGVNIGGYGDPVTIGGGEGNKYSASVTLCLSKSKLAEDKDDKKKQTGVIVKGKTLKNRFAQPIPFEVHIDFRKTFNRYIGIHPFISWENVGIAKGLLYTEKEYNKLKPAESIKCISFIPENKTEQMHFMPKETALKYVVAHLGETVSKSELFTARVMEPLKDKFDEIITKQFAFGSAGIETDIDDLVEDLSNEDIEE